MSKGLERQLGFLRRYYADYGGFQKLAYLAESYVRSILESGAADLHLVTSRAKGTASLHEKMLRKGYRNPARQVTDKIGVRVITYYGRDVDQIVKRLRGVLSIDEKNSIDKRHSLGIREFGYRSVQLVVCMAERGPTRLEFAPLAKVWFEIQIRSILEHAWAEIEHEVVYKAGIKYPDQVLRRFAAIAGSLEILEGEFLSLNSERSRLIDLYRQTYVAGDEPRKRFDVARLLGFLEAQFPGGLSWRRAEEVGKPFPYRIEARCLQALKAAGLGTAEAFTKATKTSRFRRVIRSFARSNFVGVSEVSHLALTMIAVAQRNARIFKGYFPDFLESSLDTKSIYQLTDT
jgi:ppGpp synthetase/RelA/SpoT-type nucleotidyltranferase